MHFPFKENWRWLTNANNSGSSWSQAKGHMFGSRNLGNSTDEIRAAVNICKAIEEHFQIHVNRQPESNWTWLSKLDTWDA
jgi:hypothetical protein